MSKKSITIESAQIHDDDKRIIKKCAGKHLAECCLGELIPGQTITIVKNELLNSINDELGSNYSIPHLNSWIAGRKAMPKNVRRFLKTYFLFYLFEDKEAEMLDNIQLVAFKSLLGDKEGEILNDILTE